MRAVIPTGMHLRDFVVEVCVPALIDAARDGSWKEANDIRHLIDDAFAESLPDQQPFAGGAR